MAVYGVFALDKRGFDKMISALAPENRKEGVRDAMIIGATIVRNKIRANYQKIKPQSDLYKGIHAEIYPSAEGAVVRRFYVKGGMGAQYDKHSPVYRAYILNFIEKGATDRRTKGKGKSSRYFGHQMNRGSIPAYRFFAKGFSGSRNKAFREMERSILKTIADIARRGK